MQIVKGNGGNQFRQHAGQNVGNPDRYNDVIGNQIGNGNLVAARVEGNVAGQNGTQIRCYNCRGNGLNGVQGNGIQNQIGNGNLVAVRAGGNATGQMQIVGGNGENQFRQYAGQNAGNLAGGVGHYARNCTIRPRRRDKEEAGIQLQTEEYDLMAAAADLDEIKEVNANCILMANMQQASTSSTQTDSTLVYDTDGSAE
nr:hypothetical protein [Tanacetum cinerariifolium]